MARKPVHLAAAGPGPHGREAVWAAIRNLPEFTRADLERVSGETPAIVRDYLTGLIRAGFVVSVGRAAHPGGNPAHVRTSFRLARDVGIEAPRVRKDGSAIPPSGRERMWRAAKILGEFSIRDLTLHASAGGPPVAEQEALCYCRSLAKGGYVTPLRCKPPRWRFLRSRNTGPKAPQVQRVRQVFDPNLGKVVWQSKPREES